LRARLVEVERNGYRKPEKLTFADFAERWLHDYLPGGVWTPAVPAVARDLAALTPSPGGKVSAKVLVAAGT